MSQIARTLARQIASPLALACALLTGVGCAPTVLPGQGTSFQQTLQIYRDSAPPKAMALSVDDRGHRAWGVGLGPTQDQADEQALNACAKNARAAGITARCQLLAQGDAPAEATERACAAGTLPARRCDAQRKYAPGR